MFLREERGYVLILQQVPHEELSLRVARTQHRALLRRVLQDVQTCQNALSNNRLTHFGFFEARGTDRSFKFQTRMFESSEQVKQRLFLQILTSFTLEL